MNYTYILQCADGTYYTGWTNNLEKSQGDARVLRQIAAGVLNRQAGMRLAHAIEQCPTHDAYEGFLPERLAALDLQLDLPCLSASSVRDVYTVTKLSATVHTVSSIR